MNIYVYSYICRFRYIFDLIFTYITDERWCIHWERKRGYVIFQIKNILLSPVQKWVNNCTWDWTRKWDPYLMTSKMWPKIHQGIYWYVKLWGSGTSMQYWYKVSEKKRSLLQWCQQAMDPIPPIFRILDPTVWMMSEVWLMSDVWPLLGGELIKPEIKKKNRN